MRRHKNVKVIAQDFLRAKLPDEPYKVFANIPFHLSADIVRKLTNNDETHTPQAIYLIVQKQFAQKLVQSDRHFTSQLGTQLAPWWQTRIRRPLRRTDFTPPPAVDTVLLELKPRPEPLLPTLERDKYQSFVAKCYASQKVFAAVPRAKASINPERKPSELTPEEWVRLYSMS
jgi:rRNA (adenine-N(6)-)-methyltransferase